MIYIGGVSCRYFGAQRPMRRTVYCLGGWNIRAVLAFGARSAEANTTRIMLKNIGTDKGVARVIPETTVVQQSIACAAWLAGGPSDTVCPADAHSTSEKSNTVSRAVRGRFNLIFIKLLYHKQTSYHKRDGRGQDFSLSRISRIFSRVEVSSG